MRASASPQLQPPALVLADCSDSPQHFVMLFPTVERRKQEKDTVDRLSVHGVEGDTAMVKTKRADELLREA